MADLINQVTATITGRHNTITDGMAHVNTLKCAPFAWGKDTDPDFLSFNQRVRRDTASEAWSTVKECFRRMGERYHGITLYKFKLGERKGKWTKVGLDPYALQMYFMHQSSMEAVCYFLSMYDPACIRMLAVAVCGLEMPESESSFLSVLLEQVQVVNDIYLTMKFISLAMKMAIAELNEADARKIAMFKSKRSARVIQRMWRKAVSDPNYHVCQRRLMREFQEFQE